MQYIDISKDCRFLCLEDKSPFFWLGDTAWELFHHLNREEADEYFTARAAQGFTVIQAVALAELDGLTVPNAYGRLPLKKNQEGVHDPTLPDIDGSNSYWEHVDWIISRAGRYGLYVVLLPTWGDKFNKKWGIGPEIFVPENAHAYGAWIGARYATYPNIIWMLGGDRPIESGVHRLIVRKMAEGIRDGGARQLMTYHPSGGHSSSAYVQEESWLDINAFQSGHGEGWHKSWEMVLDDRDLFPVRPVINAEPRYEDHPAYFRRDFGYIWDAVDVRTHIWWDCLSGAAGHTYGNHCIRSMTVDRTDYFSYTWREALWHDGAQQMHIAKDILLRYAPVREPMQELLLEQGDATPHLAACRNGKIALCYTPLGNAIHARLGALGGKSVRASFICPRTGAQQVLGIYPGENCTFMPPSQGKGNDWVLLLEVLDNIG